jgi:hypothetical protein
LPSAKQVSSTVAQALSGRLLTTQASAGDSALSVSISQNSGLRGW